MKKHEVLLCCGAGMSSGFLASAARKAAKRKHLPLNISARSHTEISGFLPSADLIMFGPHCVNEYAICQKTAALYDVPLYLIPQEIYGSLDGDAIADKAMELIEQKGERKPETKVSWDSGWQL